MIKHHAFAQGVSPLEVVSYEIYKEGYVPNLL